MIIDTHAHYDDEAFDTDREALLMSMYDGGIEKIVNVCAFCRRFSGYCEADGEIILCIWSSGNPSGGMPLMMGDEFLRYMKNNELFKSIPIVMLSSEESTTERIRLLEEGAEDYILKPFNFGTQNPNQKDY